MRVKPDTNSCSEIGTEGKRVVVAADEEVLDDIEAGKESLVEGDRERAALVST